MEATYPPYYISKLLLENIKCFENTEFSFLGANGQPARWVTLLGENATGKTTLLQALGILLAGIHQATTLLPSPEYWLRDENKQGHIFYECQMEMEVQSVSGPRLATHWSRYGYRFDKNRIIQGKNESLGNGRITLEIGERGGTVAAFPTFDLLAAYGSFRRLSRKESLPQTEMPEIGRFANFITLFDEESPLATFNQWISSLDYRRAKGEEAVEPLLNIGLAALDSLLPEGVRFDRERLDREGKVRFLVQGVSVATPALSDGYRSVLALGGDLIWRLLNAYPDSKKPMEEPGVVLIDELDIHLHPRWQSWIAQKLRAAFPNIQFIVATHSPLVAMGAYWDEKTGNRRDDVLTLKLEVKNGTAAVERIPDDLAAMDINRALESPAFGMVAPRPPEVEEKIERYDALLATTGRTTDEENEFQVLRQFMAEARPIGGPPEPGSFQARLEAYLREKLP